MPQLSIIIPTYNSQKTIGPLLESIFRQDFKDFEVIVADDGSRDATAEIVRQLGACFLKSDKNMGPSAARNRGAASATAGNLVFFDSDVVLKAGVLEKFNSWLSSGSVKAVIGVYDKEPLNAGLIPLYKAVQEQAWFDSIGGDKVTTFTPSVGAVRKDLFVRLGGFDATYKGAEVEDYQFSHKLLKEEVIYFDKTIKVGHNFPHFRKLVKSYFRRCFLWMKLFLDNPRFDNNSTTPQQASSVICYVFAGMSMLLGVALPPLIAVAAIFFALGLFLDRKFAYYAYRAKGFGFMMFTIGINLFLSWVILAAAFSGLVAGIAHKIKP